MPTELTNIANATSPRGTLPTADMIGTPTKPFELLYVDIHVVIDRTGTRRTLPGIFAENAIVETLLNYFLSKAKSFSWMEKVRESFRLFLQYSIVHPLPNLTATENSATASAKPHEHFRNFAYALTFGTLHRESQIDPSGLCWRPSAASKVNRVISRLTAFFTWLNEVSPSTNSRRFNPPVTGTRHDQLCARAAFELRRSKAFLGHTWGVDAHSDRISVTQTTDEPKVEAVSPPKFPDDAFDRFLLEGFQVGDKYLWRDMLIALLAHGAGFRESEPFHLYVEDVVEDPAEPGTALVRIYHPAEGIAPATWRNASGVRIVGKRREYLAQVYGMVPRTEMRGRKHAGWKGGVHEDRKRLYKQAYWFSPKYGRWFWKIWLQYLRQVTRVQRSHPFAFINLDKEAGEMYAIQSFERVHGAAVRRTGLNHATQFSTDMLTLKELGLTPHGHRHAYAQRLKEAGLAKSLIRRLMHHASEESQEQYTQASAQDLREALKAADSRMQINAASQMDAVIESILT